MVIHIQNGKGRKGDRDVVNLARICSRNSGSIIAVCPANPSVCGYFPGPVDIPRITLVRARSAGTPVTAKLSPNALGIRKALHPHTLFANCFATHLLESSAVSADYPDASTPSDLKQDRYLHPCISNGILSAQSARWMLGLPIFASRNEPSGRK